jgi:hypothetical protein
MASDHLSKYGALEREKTVKDDRSLDRLIARIVLERSVSFGAIA